jgi:hypothetical protein
MTDQAMGPFAGEPGSIPLSHRKPEDELRQAFGVTATAATAGRNPAPPRLFPSPYFPKLSAGP